MEPETTNEELEEIAESLAPFGKRLLLTGAGFSKRWGGYLTPEFWSLIVSDPRIRGQTELDRILHDDLNFEVVLNRLEHTEFADFTGQDRLVMRAAVDRAFDIQQERIEKSLMQSPGPGMLDRIVRTFTDDVATMCLFTLNQDLLIEGYNLLHSDPWRLNIPAASPTPFEVTVNDFHAEDFRAIKGRRSYIKLHGSMNWVSGLNEQVKVLGGAKPETIESFPILRMNNRIFRRALREQDARLLVIGYGFADEHINQCIAQGTASGLRIWIVDPRDPEMMQERMRKNGGGSIWRAVVGHSPSLEELFHAEREDAFRFLEERFLNS